jgi:hypothetical protein
MLSMRVAFFAIVAVNLALTAQPTEQPVCDPRSLKSYGLLGPVKSMEVESLRPDGRRVVTEKYAFDRVGRLLEDRHVISADVSEHLRYQVFRSYYRLKGPNYEIHVFDIDPAEGETPIDLQRHLVRFDLRGRCIEQLDIESDGASNGKNTYTYDSHGDLVKEIGRNSDNSIISIQNRTCRPDHKLLSENAIENRGQVLTHRGSREYRYDGRGNLTDTFSYQQGVLEAHWVYRYDERNRRVSSQTIVTDPNKDQRVYGKCFDCGLSSGETVYQYDENNRLTEERVFQPGMKLVSVKEYFYDAHGNLLPSPGGTFSYDSHGNWVEEVPGARTATDARYRVIKYY